MNDREQIVRDYVLTVLAPGEAPENLANDFDLRESGLLDSLATIELVDFIESTFKFEVGMSEARAENFGSIERLVRYIDRKSAGG